MTSVYLTNVTGDGQIRTPHRASVPARTRYAVLMVDHTKGRALIVSPSDTLSGTGIVKLLTGTSVGDLRTKTRSTGPTNAQRTTINNWLAAAGYSPLPASAVTWSEVIHAIARQVNPTADLEATSPGS